MRSGILRALWEGVADGTPFGEAVAGGVASDRLGLAFSAGYRAAVRALVPAVADRRAALCVTEDGGGHPKAMRTRLADGRVTGRKTFVTFGSQAEVLLVVAREGDEGPLRLTWVDAAGPGIMLEPLPPLPFAPEIPHAAVVLTEARAEVLPGDGYDAYVKPFRTVEDVQVFGAALAYVFGAGRRGHWGADRLAELAASVLSLAALAAEDPAARETHLVLGGALATGRALLAKVHMTGLSEEEKLRWERDRPLLEVAGKVRAQRMAAAASSLGL